MGRVCRPQPDRPSSTFLDEHSTHSTGPGPTRALTGAFTCVRVAWRARPVRAAAHAAERRTKESGSGRPSAHGPHHRRLLRPTSSGRFALSVALATPVALLAWSCGSTGLAYRVALGWGFLAAAPSRWPSPCSPEHACAPAADRSVEGAAVRVFSDPAPAFARDGAWRADLRCKRLLGDDERRFRRLPFSLVARTT